MFFGVDTEVADACFVESITTRRCGTVRRKGVDLGLDPPYKPPTLNHGWKVFRCCYDDTGRGKKPLYLLLTRRSALRPPRGIKIIYPSTGLAGRDDDDLELWLSEEARLFLMVLGLDLVKKYVGEARMTLRVGDRRRDKVALVYSPRGF